MLFPVDGKGSGACRDDRLGSSIEGDETAEDLIRRGRCLFETDDDACSRGHCIVHDEDYNELAPWSSAKRKYELIYKE
ncbi:MAG: hypothetical protein IKI75_03515 [Lachnospiraceae bacterium]|nr:hypothetical protein [Lachnospiraceae bacterium]